MTDEAAHRPQRTLIRATRARAEMLGGISHMTEWRWQAAYPEMPRPFRIGAQNFYDVSELESWIESFRVSATDTTGEAGVNDV